MTDQRAHRVGEEIKREVSSILRTEIKDPRVTGLISVTDVAVTRDLRHAKLFISMLGSEEEQQETLSALSRAVGFIRSEIGKRIRLRHTPEISFHLDKSIEYGAHINKILADLNPGGEGQTGE
ncbi:30S ribosome-binding factor RbfA [Dethiobacter alkaliphilus]|uniref:30S ribosome-binding factor RbfA n=1 Tax=Dethiobacter alkaliphilus TaxID=427926 RepID=UPI002227B968|nr:30S ribosome-binding factor RbfA [Dethiobacter alkaliphilus]MCW3490841.1 30S ribosome-binding factor RbfA [Dethiobacter alkaliphilus]